MRRHLLGIRGMTRTELENHLENALSFGEVSGRDIKKVPALRGKTVINLFLEPSTRTRASFEIAGKWLSADTINIGEDSSVKKGETLADTARNLEAMSPDVLVVRHRESGAPHLLAKLLTKCSVINAGDGLNEHPTQALLDCLTLKHHFRDRAEGISGLRIAIVGDVRHSRVARSNIWAHLLLGNEICLVGPPTLVPAEFADPRAFGGNIRISHSLGAGIEGSDVVMCLRVQRERQDEHFLPSLEEYTTEYGVTESKLRKFAPQAVVLHPGPVNRGIEVSSEVIDGPRSLVTQQVTFGVAVRMAALFTLATGTAGQREQSQNE